MEKKLVELRRIAGITKLCIQKGGNFEKLVKLTYYDPINNYSFLILLNFIEISLKNNSLHYLLSNCI